MKTAKVCTKGNITDMGMDQDSQKRYGSGIMLKNTTEDNEGSGKGSTGYLQDVDTDLNNIFLAFQGRIRFGDGVDNARGENMSGEFHIFTTSTANTEVVVPHFLKAIPVGHIVIKQDKAGSLYDSTTAWTGTNIYVKCDAATVTFKIFLVK